LKKSALLCAVILAASLATISCNGGPHPTLPPSKLTERVFASQSASTTTVPGSLVVINGYNDTLGRGAISAGTSPGLMSISPDRTTLMVFDMATNTVGVVNTQTQALTGSAHLPGPTTSMVTPLPSAGYVAVPSAPFSDGTPPGAIAALNLTSPGVSSLISVPSAQTVVSNTNGTQLLVFSNDSDSVTVVSPLLVNSGSPVTVTVPGFDRPVNAVYSGDGTVAYVLNCGPQCGGTQASVQILNVGTTPPTAGQVVPVDAATIGFLSGSTLYVAGTPPTNNACTGQTTAAATCGRLSIVDTSSLTVTGTAVITDGYHNRIDLGNGGQLFVGSYDCTNIGNVNNPSGEVRGCLSIYNTLNNTIVIPPDNGDVTGLQTFSSRYVEYVAEGGNLRVYDTQTDTLLENQDFISTGTIIITGIVTDVKAVDFF
jgi:hypothetical protein